ncbi:MAG: Arginine--tRNA ligase [Phycisphaerae bacterium]|nr:Arginine--tRNA ligase [Phycisphaerae bacterium]
MSAERVSVQELLSSRFAEAIARVAGVAPQSVDPQVRAAADARFGDYQCNVAMSLARTLKLKPREVAERIVDEATKGAGATERRSDEATKGEAATIFEPLEIAGPGFINIRLTDEFLSRYLAEIPAADASPAPAPNFAERWDSVAPDEPWADRFGIPPVNAAHRQRVVVDYSSPNIAKQMHVGHLRSTIIGDVFVRVLEFEGHAVRRQNHVGDWGTQFGMLIAYYADHPMPDVCGGDVMAALEADYRAARSRFESDPEFASAARLAVTKLQQGDVAARLSWEAICLTSEAGFAGLYVQLGVKLRKMDNCGESFYQRDEDRLTPVVEELRAKLPPRSPEDQPPPLPVGRVECRDDQGALCLFFYDAQDEPRFKGPDGSELPMIIRKSDGAFLYATTDLAALRYRTREIEFVEAATEPRSHGATEGSEGATERRSDEGENGHGATEPTSHAGAPTGVLRGATRLIYVTDARQKLHFEMLFAAARAVGWAPPDRVRLEHVTFGSVLGDDKKPLKTRSGENVKLQLLLNEAIERAKAVLQKRFVDDEIAKDFQIDEDANQDEALDAELEAVVKERRTVGYRLYELVANTVGVAAVKYADLCRDRNSDYVFSWDKMLAMQGNTAPYLMYAYARIRSIYRKAATGQGLSDADLTRAVYDPSVRLALDHAAERALALRLARLHETIDELASNLLPHVLCSYLYELAADFMRFYENCPVVQAADEATRLSRLRLCDLTARALKLGLHLLGIEVIESM